MIGFVISSHGQFGTVHQDGRRDEGLSIVFSCGLTSPIDLLLKESIVKIKHILLKILHILYFLIKKNHRRIFIFDNFQAYI